MNIQRKKKGVEEILIVGSIKNYIGYHIIAELSKVNKDRIKYKKDLEKIIKEVINKSGLNLVDNTTPYLYQFNPYGVSGIAFLKESHISFHTWPEKNYVALDIFSCGKKEIAERAYKVFKEFLKPGKIKKIILYRKP